MKKAANREICRRFFSDPPCRDIANKTRTKQVGKRPSDSRSLRPQAGGLQSTHGAEFPYKMCWIIKNYIFSNKAEILLLCILYHTCFKKSIPFL